MTKTFSRVVAMLLACGFAACAQSADTGVTEATVRIGNINVPANCALAKKEHPRLLFTKADLPDIRARIAKPGLKPIYDRLKSMVDERMSSITTMDSAHVLVPLGLLYQITGDEKYGQACRAVTLKAPFNTYLTMGGYGYDLVYDLMTPEERSACEAKMLGIARQGNAGSTWLGPMMNALGIWGNGANDDEVGRLISDMHQAMLERKKWLNVWAADRGGDGNSHGVYIGQHEYVGTVGAFQAWRASTGEDLFNDFIWVKGMGPYHFYNILPGSVGTAHIGNDADAFAFYPRETGAEAFLSIAQTKWQDGLTGEWVRNTVCGGTAWWDVLCNYWGMVLYYNPDVPDVPRSKAPEDMLFKTRGYAYMRSDWGNDATFVLFNSGRYEYDSRCNADCNSFMIWRKGGYLACDSGQKAAVAEGAALTDGYDYWPQTIAHNSMTIGTANDPTNYGQSKCGGQCVRVPPEWLEMYGMPVTEDNKYARQAGQITAYETSPEFVYAVGDARCAYDPHVVKAFTRQFLYVRPGAIVIFDRVNAVNAADPKRWYLHTMEKPECIDGAMKPDTAIHPEGHFLASGKTLRSPHKGSVLFSKTLLPEKAIVRVLGGKGHQFEVNGVNGDMKEEWWAKMDNPDGKAYIERIGLGFWRVEVEPEVKQADDVFLHVLWATDDGAKEMVPVTKIEKNGQVGAQFRADGCDIEVTFAQTGDVAGHVKIVKGGKPVCDRPLASSLEDNYQKWKSDPRFTEWMTSPYMRSVIGEKDQDAYKAAAGKK